jgi:hypothetical protein
MADARPSSDGRGIMAKAVDALEQARAMPRGPERTQALKQAGLLRFAADKQRSAFAKRAKPA